MDRRTLLKSTVFGAVALAGAGLVATITGRDPAADREQVLRALAPAILAGALAPDGPSRVADLDRALGGVRQAVAALPPAVRTDLDQLFGLLAAPPTRLALAGLTAGWDAVTPQQAADFLARWRDHRVTLFRAGYQALRDLVLAAWYADEASWAAVGYPGPPDL